MAESTLWKDRKHVLWFPITHTKYEVRNERLYVQKGLLRTTFDETLLYRITDIQLTRTLGQKLCGTGTILLCTKIDHDAHIALQNVKHPKRVKELLSDAIEQARIDNDVVGKEFYDAVHPDRPPLRRPTDPNGADCPHKGSPM